MVSTLLQIVVSRTLLQSPPIVGVEAAVAVGNRPDADMAAALDRMGHLANGDQIDVTAFNDYRLPGYKAVGNSDTDTPLLNDQMKQDIASAKGINFSTAADNKANNVVPDYRLTVGSDGQLHLEKVGDGPQSQDGKLNIEIDPQNKSLIEAIKSADVNLKEYIREMMTMWQNDHPNEGHPGWWDDVLNGQPNIPMNAEPIQPVSVPPPVPAEMPAWPQPATTPQVDTPPIDGPGGTVGAGTDGPAPSNAGDYNPYPGGYPGLGGFANKGGFDDQGMYHSRGADQDGTVWSGDENAAGQPMGPGEKVPAKEIYDYLRNQCGFNDVVASGILGNIQTESSFRTDAYNRREGAIGICQWEGPRRQELQAFAAADPQHRSITDVHLQLDFMMYELKHKPTVYNALMASQSPEQAAQIFQSKFEVSASLGNRAANARNIYAQFAQPGNNSNLVA